MKTLEITDRKGVKADVSMATVEKIQTHKNAGYEIVINKNWQTAGKGFEEEIKLCQTNKRTCNGGIKHVIWAVK